MGQKRAPLGLNQEDMGKKGIDYDTMFHRFGQA